ncbi:protein kinase domain-containing protein [Devosia sp. CN2-171]|uniref:protein kinase domain-containing protein n=1 Tax=Devosia sp. CN2-171 TaxID=3400909 RepID=UPI003BF77F71
MSTARSTLPAGYLLEGDYEILSVLGAGGFGTTYRARYKLGNFFAVKEYSPSDLYMREGATIYPYEDSEEQYHQGLADFLHEARTLARFSHPNIVKVARIIEANNTAYMVLEFEEGQSLKEWLLDRQTKPNQAELDAIIGPLLDALELIHADNILHRDVAPDNIYVRRNGTPVLLDFGSARPGTARSHSVSAIVKAGYSPQEQYSSRAQNQGPWTDIYSLGATLYKAVTGEAPPDATERVVDDEYRRVSKRLPSGYRSNFLAAIDWALEVRPDDRPQVVEQWRGPLLKNTAVPPRAHRAETARGDPPPKSGLRAWSVTAAIAVALALVAGFATWSYSRGEIGSAVAAAQATMAQQVAGLESQLAAARRQESQTSIALAAAKADMQSQVAALTSQAETARTSAARLQDQLAVAQAAAANGEANATAQVAVLQTQLDDVNAHAADLEARLQVDRGDLENEITALQQQLATERRAKEALRTESAAIRAQLEDKVATSEQAAVLARQATERAEAALAEVRAAAATAAEKSADLIASTRDEAAALTKQLEAERKSAATASADDRAEAEKRVAVMEESLAAAKAREEQLIASGRVAMAGLEEKIRDLTARVEVETAGRAAAEEEATTSRADLVRLREQDARRIAQLETDLATAREGEQSAIASLTAAREGGGDQLKQLTTQIASSKARISALESTLSAERDAAAQTLEGERAQSDARIAVLRKQLTDEQTRATDLSAKLEEIRARNEGEVALLRQQLVTEQVAKQRLVDEHSAAEAAAGKRVAELEAELSASNDATAEIQTALATAREDVTAAQAQVAAAGEAKQQADTELAKAREAAKAAEGVAAGRIAELETQLASGEVAITTAAADAASSAAVAQAELAEERRAATALKEAAAARVAELESAVASAAATAKRFETELASKQAQLQTQIAELNDNLAAEAAAKEGLETAVAAAKLEYDGLQKKSEARIAELATEIDLGRGRETAAAEALKAAQASADAKIAELSAQMATAQQGAAEDLRVQLEATRNEYDIKLAELQDTLQNQELARQSLVAESQVLMGIAMQPGIDFAGVELASALERGGFFVRGVDPESPLNGAIQAGTFIETMSLNGVPVDLAESSATLAACDVLVARVAGAESDISVTVPQGAGLAISGATRFAGVGLSLAPAGADGELLVAEVDGGSLAPALRRGDILVGFDGQPVTTAEAFSDAIAAAARGGGKRSASVERDCERIDVTLDFGAEVQSFDYAGLTLEGTDASPARVASVDPTSIFSQAGLLPGDHLDSLSVHGETLDFVSFTAARGALDTLTLCGPVDVAYTRGNAKSTATIDTTPDRGDGPELELAQLGIGGYALGDGRGILVDGLTPGSRAGAAGLARGDIITAMGRTRGAALSGLTTTAEGRFLRQGGVLSVTRGCDDIEIKVAAYDPRNEPVEIAELTQVERRFVIRALYAMGHYKLGDMPTGFVTSGEIENPQIAAAFVAFRTAQGEADDGLSRNDVDYLLPLGQSKMPSELEQDALHDVVPPVVAMNAELIENRLRLWASQQGFDADTGREAISKYQQSVGVSESVGFVTSPAEARAIFTDPMPLTVGPLPEGERNFSDWRLTRDDNSCVIYVLPTRITGAFYQYTRNTSRADRPALWIGVYRDAAGPWQMSVNFGGSIEFDQRLAVTMSTNSSSTPLNTLWSGNSLVPPLAADGAHTSDELHKVLLTSDWVELHGTSKYGGPLDIRYNTSGFRQAFDYLNSDCADDTLSSWIR